MNQLCAYFTGVVADLKAKAAAAKAALPGLQTQLAQANSDLAKAQAAFNAAAGNVALMLAAFQTLSAAQAKVSDLEGAVRDAETAAANDGALYQPILAVVCP